MTSPTPFNSTSAEPVKIGFCPQCGGQRYQGLVHHCTTGGRLMFGRLTAGEIGRQELNRCA